MRPSQPNVLSYAFVAVSFGLFVAFFAAYHERIGNVLSLLFIVPITIGSWYFGIRGGVLTAVMSISSYTTLRVFSGETPAEIFTAPAPIIGIFVLVFSGVVVGRLAGVTRERRNAIIKLARSSDLTSSLLRVTAHLESGLAPDEMMQALGEELRKTALSSAIALFNVQSRTFTIKYLSLDRGQLEELENIVGFPLLNYTFPANGSRLKIEEKFQPAIIASTPRDEFVRIFPGSDAGKLAASPLAEAINAGQDVLRLLLMFEEKLLGVLWVWGNGISASDLPIMSIFAKQIGTSLERARLFQEVQSLALMDHLTSLHNRRSLFELGRIEFSRAHRFNRPFSCAMLDLDHFKQVNDTYGHSAGDRVLQEFAKRCKDSVREIDLVGRYGGEELTILMPETKLETAVRVAERLRAITSETGVHVGTQQIHITTSIGVAAKDENTAELETLIARADQAMYIAKHKGRNRVAVSK